MTTLSARFRQSPTENLRYVLDYKLFCAPTESIASVVANSITQTPGTGVAETPLMAITGLNVVPAVAPAIATTAAFFASGGVDQGVYEVQFLATTSLGQVLEDIVEYTLALKL